MWLRGAVAVEYTTLGKTGLKVSMAGLGCGGFSRLGLSAGKTEDEAVLLVREAVDMGINFVESWLRKFEQGDKWSFCLTAGTLWPANQERP
jgi:predicted aldo/keto reductase-like oxidoreductase